MFRQRQGQGQGQRQRQGQNQQPQQRQNQGPQPYRPRGAGQPVQVNYAAAQPGPFDPARYANATQTNLSLDAQNAIHRENQRRRRNGERLLSNSEQLSTALEVDGGVPNPRNAEFRTQTHHVVESSNEQIQDVFRNLDMNRNASFNGVHLPEVAADDTGNATTHLGSHVQGYTEAVTEAVMRSLDWVPDNLRGQRARRQATAQSVAGQVGRIRDVLLTDQVPLNARNDSNYNPNTGQPYTVHEIFEERGLFQPPQ